MAQLAIICSIIILHLATRNLYMFSHTTHGNLKGRKRIGCLAAKSVEPCGEWFWQYRKIKWADFLWSPAFCLLSNNQTVIKWDQSAFVRNTTIQHLTFFFFFIYRHMGDIWRTDFRWSKWELFRFTALTWSNESMKLFKSEHSENNSKSDKKSLQMANTCVCECMMQQTLTFCSRSCVKRTSTQTQMLWKGQSRQTGGQARMLICFWGHASLYKTACCPSASMEGFKFSQSLWSNSPFLSVLVVERWNVGIVTPS